MKKLVITFCAILCAGLAFAQQPVIHKLGDYTSIVFPDKPEAKPTTNGSIYILYKDSITYLAEEAKVQKGLGDYISGSTDSIYAGFIKGSLGKSGSKPFYSVKINYNGLNGIEFAYKASTVKETTYRYNRAFYFNSRLVLVEYWTVDSLKRDDERISAFFNTLKINLAQKDIRQENANEIAYGIGKVIGTIAFVIVLAAFGIGIVFVIRKIAYKKD